MTVQKVTSTGSSSMQAIVERCTMIGRIKGNYGALDPGHSDLASTLTTSCIACRSVVCRPMLPSQSFFKNRNPHESFFVNQSPKSIYRQYRPKGCIPWFRLTVLLLFRSTKSLVCNLSWTPAFSQNDFQSSTISSFGFFLHVSQIKYL